jgi:hypothetical protein
MEISEFLSESFDRIRGLVHDVLDEATPGQLVWRPYPEANTVSWLVWHLIRVQDDHVSEAAGAAQSWLVDGWADRFGLPFDDSATGYGQHPEEVGALSVAPGLLRDYHDAVYERTIRYVRILTDGDLDRIVDDSWDPPVSLGSRLISVIGDDLQHLGQAAYILGLASQAGQE